MKFLLATKLILLAATVGFVFLPITASAKQNLNCNKLNGVWSGKMSGLLNGKTTMTIANCRVNWRLPDGRANNCVFSERAGRVEYRCSLGSHGIVVIKRNKIAMQNIYTAAEHGAYRVDVSKVRK